jgi:hypothetical protein
MKRNILFGQDFSPILFELGSWTVGQLDSWTVGQLDSWTIGQLDNWTVGQFAMEHWNFGTLELINEE